MEQNCPFLGLLASKGLTGTQKCVWSLLENLFLPRWLFWRIVGPIWGSALINARVILIGFSLQCSTLLNLPLVGIITVWTKIFSFHRKDDFIQFLKSLFDGGRWRISYTSGLSIEPKLLLRYIKWYSSVTSSYKVLMVEFIVKGL